MLTQSRYAYPGPKGGFVVALVIIYSHHKPLCVYTNDYKIRCKFVISMWLSVHGVTHATIQSHQFRDKQIHNFCQAHFGLSLCLQTWHGVT